MVIFFYATSKINYNKSTKRQINLKNKKKETSYQIDITELIQLIEWLLQIIIIILVCWSYFRYKNIVSFECNLYVYNKTTYLVTKTSK